MSKVAVAYWSGTGNTGMMADAIAEGVTEKGGTVELVVASDFSSVKVADYTALAFGCPSMGAEVLEECEFQPMWDDVMGSLAGKPVVLFGSYGWGDGQWMRDWEEQAKTANINVVETVIANETPDDDAKATCKAAGGKLAG